MPLVKLNQSGNQIKIVCSDRGGEFLSQKNGTAERGMRTRAEQAQALLYMVAKQDS